MRTRQERLGVREIGKLTLAPYSMLALALIGIAAAVYVAHGNYTGQPLWCPIVDGCNAVVNSPYSRVLGVPMSYFGFIYFLYMFALAARLAFDPLSRSLRFRAILYAAMGAASSMYFMYLQLAFIREVCSLLSHCRRHDFPSSHRRTLAPSSDAETGDIRA